MIPIAIFVPAVALQTKFSRKVGSMPNISTHVLSNPREHITGCLVRSFWGVLREYGVDGRRLLAVK